VAIHLDYAKIVASIDPLIEDIREDSLNRCRADEICKKISKMINGFVKKYIYILF
jgi:hypothetical protein